MTEPTESNPRLTDPRSMSFGDHLEDLRKRLLYALLGILPIFITAVVFGDQILSFLVAPVLKELRASGYPGTLQATEPMETFSAYFKVAIVLSIVFGLPWAVYQLWLFIAPGLYDHEKRFARFLVPLSVSLSALGLAFLYWVMLPAIMAFLVNFGTDIGTEKVATAPLPPGVVLPTLPSLEKDPVDPAPWSYWYNHTLEEWRMAVPRPDGTMEIRGTPMNKLVGIAQQYRISTYIGMVFGMGLAFSLGFQLPVVVLLLGWIGVVDRKFLAKHRKYAVFACAVAGAVLTPSPDPLSMMLLTVPLWLLYEFGMILMRLLPPGRIARGFKFGRWHIGSKEPPDAADG